jgi:hypothetical protein
LGRKASEKDSGSNTDDGNAGCDASHAAVAERNAGNGTGHGELEHREIASQQQTSQTQQGRAPQIAPTPHRETAHAVAVGCAERRKNLRFAGNLIRYAKRGARQLPFLSFRLSRLGSCADPAALVSRATRTACAV